MYAGSSFLSGLCNHAPLAAWITVRVSIDKAKCSSYPIWGSENIQIRKPRLRKVMLMEDDTSKWQSPMANPGHFCSKPHVLQLLHAGQERHYWYLRQKILHHTQGCTTSGAPFIVGPRWSGDPSLPDRTTHKSTYIYTCSTMPAP